jgi:hypothetical protein
MDTALLPLDPNNLARLYKRSADGERISDPALDALSAALGVAFQSGEKISALASALKDDLTIAPAARALKLRETALKLGASAAAKLDAAKERALREMEAVERQTGSPPPPANPLAMQLEAELRAHLASMKQSERDKYLGKPDDVIAAAVLRGHPALCSMTEAEQKIYRERWRQTRYAAEADRIARLTKAIEAVERAGAALVSYVGVHANTQHAKQVAAGTVRTQAALERVMT